MIYLIIVSVIWSISFTLIKGSLTGVDPYFISFSRLLISFIVFLPLLKFRSLDRKLSLHLLIIGALQYGLMYIAYINAYQYLKAYEVAILTIFTPLFVVLIYDIWTKKFVKIHWIKAAFAIVGAGVILYTDEISLGFWKGILLIQVSNFLFALGQVYYKNLFEGRKDLSQSEYYAILFLGSVIISGIFSFSLTNFNSLTVSSNQILILVYLGGIASGLGFFLWNYGVTKATAGSVALLNNLKIPLGILFAFIFLDEYINAFQLIFGGLLFIVGLYWESIIKKIR